MKKKVLGSHWVESGHTELYQLYRRVENVARDLNKRRKAGHVATRDYIDELQDIAMQLKILDKKRVNPLSTDRKAGRLLTRARA